MAPVAVWVRVMSTPGRTPPLSSFTVPPICAVEPAWAPRVAVASDTRHAPDRRVFNMRVIRLDSFQDARGVPGGAMRDMKPDVEFYCQHIFTCMTVYNLAGPQM